MQKPTSCRRRPCGRRGLKHAGPMESVHRRRRRPRGRRGLKQSRLRPHDGMPVASPPARAAWIETSPLASPARTSSRRRPRGRRGLKHAASGNAGATTTSRRPRGRRGLKHAASRAVAWQRPAASRPARAAWIETLARAEARSRNVASPPARAAWIETALVARFLRGNGRRRPRGRRGLKHTELSRGYAVPGSVAARAGGVD